MATRKFHSPIDFYNWLDDGPANGRYSRRRCFIEGRNWAALYDALTDADMTDRVQRQAAGREAGPDDLVAVPRWALDAAAAEVKALLGKKITSRGKPWIKRYKQDLIDWYRYQQVWFRRLPPDTYPQHRDDLEKRREFFRQQRGAGVEIVDTADTHPWTSGRRGSDIDVFDAASITVRGSVYQGNRATIKTSWEKVNAAIKRGEFWRYYPSRWVRFKGHHRVIQEETLAK